eukprot:CAMPEP_0113307430 /NCGR_PEP_ID=MMETSP0010_2-20120614/6277_1 /TAXON_ID=216773 ORGANISM="Corethron hystrix, Strain 308" /NCGR_SAMPLE_ID=MMETSP0010_2 /ASSEMBLY_ACC=CAM_ASM_000155 /LENGTH=1108 /DNA_ID=CAMNT_0000162281 /DNA_START=107 /DNA_END=3433 /DNA_ORIENTATION=+ /assembly_acc=CAM_ASM_000155
MDTQATSVHYVQKDGDVVENRNDDPISPPTSQIPELHDHSLLLGRNDELNALDRILDNHGSTVLLVGHTGVGKTQCAKFFATAWKSMAPRRFVWWLSASSENNLREGYRYLLEALGYLDVETTVTMTTERLAKSVWKYLHAMPYDWMLVYDDCRDQRSPQTGRDFKSNLLPRLDCLGRGRLLFTSEQDFMCWDEDHFLVVQVERINVGLLTEADCLELLVSNGDILEKSNKQYLNELPRTMVQLMGCQPLSLDVMAAYLADSGTLLQEYMVRRLGNFCDFHDSAIQDVIKYATGKGDLGAVVDLIAYLNPEWMPLVDLLGKECEESFLQLSKLKLIQHFSEGVYSVHPVMQQLMRDTRSPLTALRVLELHVSFFDAKNTETWPRARKIVPHIRALLGHVNLLGSGGFNYFSAAAKLTIACSTIMQKVFKDFKESESLLTTVINNSISFGRSKETDPEFYTAYLELGRLYEAKDMYTEAQERYEEALKIKRSYDDPMSEELESLLLKLGMLYKRQKLYDAASIKYVKVLRIKRHRDGQKAVNTGIADILYILGFLSQKSGDNEEALKKFEEALRMYHIIHGEAAIHPDIAMTVYNIGSILQYLGENDQALLFFHEALDMKMKIYGPDSNNFDIAKTLRSIGYSYNFCGHYDPAMTKLEEALTMYKNVYGLDAVNSELADTLNNLGNVYKARGNFDDANTKYREALEMYRHGHETYGNEEMLLNVAMVLRNLGAVAICMNDRGSALRLLDEALQIYPAVKEQKGSTTGRDLETVAFLAGLAGCFNEIEEHEEAKQVLQNAVSILGNSENEGVTKIRLANTLHTLGNVYKTLKDYEGARLVFEESLCSYGDEGDKMVEKARTLNNLCAVLVELDDVDGAMEKVTESLRVLKQVYGSDSLNMDFYASLCNLGMVYSIRGNLSDSQFAYDEAEVIFRKLKKTDDYTLDFAQVLFRQGKVYFCLKLFTNARDKLRESIEIMDKIFGEAACNVDLIQAYLWLGRAEMNLEELEAAKSILKSTMAMQINIHGKEAKHASIAEVMCDIGTLTKRMGDYEASETMFKGALDMYTDVYKDDPNHASILMCIEELKLFQQYGFSANNTTSTSSWGCGSVY